MVQLRKKDVEPMVHDLDFRPIRGRENLSAPPKLESRPTCHDWDCDVIEAFFTLTPHFEPS